MLRWKTRTWEGVSFLTDEKKGEKTRGWSRFKDFWRNKFSRPLQTEPAAPYGISSGRSWEYDEWMGIERKTNAQEKNGKAGSAKEEQTDGKAGAVKEKRPNFFRRRFEDIEPRLAALIIFGAVDDRQEGA